MSKKNVLKAILLSVLFGLLANITMEFISLIPYFDFFDYFDYLVLLGAIIVAFPILYHTDTVKLAFLKLIVTNLSSWIFTFILGSSGFNRYLFQVFSVEPSQGNDFSSGIGMAMAMIAWRIVQIAAVLFIFIRNKIRER